MNKSVATNKSTPVAAVGSASRAAAPSAALVQDKRKATLAKAAAPKASCFTAEEIVQSKVNEDKCQNKDCPCGPNCMCGRNCMCGKSTSQLRLSSTHSWKRFPPKCNTHTHTHNNNTLFYIRTELNC